MPNFSSPEHDSLDIISSLKLEYADKESDVAKEELKKKNPNFNVDELEGTELSLFASMQGSVVSKERELVRLVEQGRAIEAFNLAQRIKEIIDPSVSFMTSGLKEELIFNGGDFKKVSRNFGLSGTVVSEKWLEYIVRTWGMSPKDFKPADETYMPINYQPKAGEKLPGWRGFVADIIDYAKEKDRVLDIVEWPNATLFKRCYIPGAGVSFRGMRNMDAQKVINCLEQGIASPLLQRLGSIEAISAYLSGQDLGSVFAKHFAGAGKGEDFWRSPDESPFVAVSRHRQTPLWHAKFGEPYRVIFELTPSRIGYFGGLVEDSGTEVKKHSEAASKSWVNSPFDRPFVYRHDYELAYYPQIDPEDIAKVHLLPGEIKVINDKDPEDVIPATKNPIYIF